MKKSIIFSALFALSFAAFADENCEGEVEPVEKEESAMIDVSPTWVDAEKYVKRLKVEKALADMKASPYYLTFEDASYLAK